MYGTSVLLRVPTWTLRAYSTAAAADHRDEHAPHRPARVDGFPRGDELDSKLMQFVNDFEKVLCAAGDAIKSAHEQDGELAPPRIREHGIKTGALRLAARDAPVGVFAHDFETASRGELAEVEQLILDMLVGRAHSRVNCGSFHIPSK
jgi:hypothetical protein